MKDKKKSIGFSYAFNGIKEVIKMERNFQIHLISATLVIIIGIFLNISLVEWLIITLTIGLVLIAELINSAIEQIIDYIKPDRHPTAKLIKDIGAGAVLVAAIIAVIVGLIVFMPKLMTYF